MPKLDKTIYEPHPITPERKRELNSKGFRIIDARFKPKEVAVHTEGGSRTAPGAGDGYPPDDELRAAIEAATGKAPHHKTGRAKLIEMLEATKTAAQNETASNAVTRSEIEADLAAMGVEFNATDPVEDLSVLRDMAKAEREGA